MSSYAVKWAPVLFGFTLFIGSALLFLIEPIVARALLPLLGGTEIAWNACLVGFQACLLAGFVYGDVLHRYKGMRWQPVLQLVLIVSAIAFCFMGVFGDDLLQSLTPRLSGMEGWPILTTVSVLLVVVGLPFMLLAAAVPLLQRWFAHLEHPKASDPFFLFAASNLGGLFAVVVHALMIEPNSPSGAHWLAWKLAMCALAILLLLSAFCVWMSPRNPELEPPEKPSDPNAPVVPQLIGRGPATWPRRWYWLAAAAIPAGMLLGLTNVLSQDLPASPILWCVPLGLLGVATAQAFGRFTVYEDRTLTFKLVLQGIYGIFLLLVAGGLAASMANERGNDHDMGISCTIFFALLLFMPSSWVPVLQPISVLAAVFVQANVFKPYGAYPTVLLLHLVCFYLSARLCMEMLAKDRPAAAAVTEYFAWIAGGGLAGTFAVAVIAPRVFWVDLLEYPILAGAACMLRVPWLQTGWSEWLACKPFMPKPDPEKPEPPAWRPRVTLIADFVLPVLIAGAASLLFLVRNDLRTPREMFADFPLLIAVVVAGTLIARPVRFGLALVLIVLVCWIGQGPPRQESILARQRSAFGILRVSDRNRALPVLPDRTLPPTARERTLMHGPLTHGSCILEPASLTRQGTGVYHQRGPAGKVMRRFDWFGPTRDQIRANPQQEFWFKKHPDNAPGDARIAASLIGLGAMGPGPTMVGAWSEPPIAAVGLGAGSVFQYAHPYQWIDVYELDQAVIDFSEGNAPLFPCLSAARKRGAYAEVIPGEPRRNLAYFPAMDREAAKAKNLTTSRGGREGYYHALFIDVRNASTVRPHLLTRQAIETYFHKLAPDGILCIHTSNAQLDTHRVVETVARRLEIPMRHLKPNDPRRGEKVDPFVDPSEWVVLTRSQDTMRRWAESMDFVMDNDPNRFFGDTWRVNWNDEHIVPFAAGRNDRGGWALFYGLLGVLLGYCLLLGVLEMYKAATPVESPKTQLSVAK
jgi:hypothetical protein